MATASYVLIGIIVLLQVILAFGNYFLRPIPRRFVAKLMIVVGLLLACAVVVQFLLGQAGLNAAIFNLRGQMFGLMGGGSL